MPIFASAVEIVFLFELKPAIEERVEITLCLLFFGQFYPPLRCVGVIVTKSPPIGGQKLKQSDN